MAKKRERPNLRVLVMDAESGRKVGDWRAYGEPKEEGGKLTFEVEKEGDALPE